MPSQALIADAMPVRDAEFSRRSPASAATFVEQLDRAAR